MSKLKTKQGPHGMAGVPAAANAHSSFEEGQAARLRGEPRDSNPYEGMKGKRNPRADFGKAMAWSRGWESPPRKTAEPAAAADQVHAYVAGPYPRCERCGYPPNHPLHGHSMASPGGRGPLKVTDFHVEQLKCALEDVLPSDACEANVKALDAMDVAKESAYAKFRALLFSGMDFFRSAKEPD